MFLAAGVGTAGLVALMAPTVRGITVVPPCLFHTVTGLDCPFCGGTRATRALLTGDVGAAADFNILVPLLAVVAIALGGWWLAARTERVSFDGAAAVLRSRAVWLGIVAALALFWVLRNLPWLGYLSSGG